MRINNYLNTETPTWGGRGLPHIRKSR